MKKHLPILGLLGCAALFGFGVLQLFKLRFEQGDIYPPYSSLRADPLGTMVFYESLEQVPGVSVQRDHSAVNRLPPAKNTTYLHIAGRLEEWDGFPDEIWKEIDGFLINGGRLAITFFPETGWNFWTSGTLLTTTTNPVVGTNSPGFKAAQQRKRANLKKLLRQQGRDLHEVSLEDHWGVSFRHMPLAKTDNDIYQPAQVMNATQLALPGVLNWHSAIVFTNLNHAWQTIYARGKAPVVIERKFGAGSVVLATDSYFVSNEALLVDRHPDLLAWLVGPNQHMVFDEGHFGMVEQGGIALLIRKYRLHGLAVGLLVLAGLFIWKNAVSLVPVLPAQKSRDHIAGKDTAAGFINLLRRNIPARDVLNVCFTEWTKTLLSGKHYTIAGVDQAQTVLAEENARVAGRHDPVDAYKRICAALDSSKFRVPSSEARAPQTPTTVGNQSA